MANQDMVLESKDIILPTKVSVVTYGFESWTVKKTERKNWCLWIVVVEKTRERPLDSKEIKIVTL